jgi:hypothetical protein
MELTTIVTPDTIMRSLKSECLDRMIFFGQRSLERALKEFVAH